MADDVRWMTYGEIAEVLGIGPDSARNLVRRKRWARQTGNDGLARVGVPVEHLALQEQTVRKLDPPIDPPIDGGDDAGVEGTITQVLERHVERLERELELLRGERDAERIRAAQVDALQAVLEVERARISAVEADRDRWHLEVQAEREARRAEAEQAQIKVDVARAEFEAWRAQPWWRRALG